jgi:hypothetical protein
MSDENEKELLKHVRGIHALVFFIAIMSVLIVLSV